MKKSTVRPITVDDNVISVIALVHNLVETTRKENDIVSYAAFIALFLTRIGMSKDHPEFLSLSARLGAEFKVQIEKESERGIFVDTVLLLAAAEQTAKEMGVV